MEPKKFSLDQVIQLLIDWQQTLTPERFESSKDLDTLDFGDAPSSAAQGLGIEEEYEAALKLVIIPEVEGQDTETEEIV